ncbi:MAG: inter-alpha-trypsin inhibitor domain-containing protein [Pirellulaceae bacterium]|nr:MAG: inter-alpha-trypsin inhibitor domain-containing protein [Pirellulaceae bacterium]
MRTRRPRQCGVSMAEPVPRQWLACVAILLPFAILTCLPLICSGTLLGQGILVLHDPPQPVPLPRPIPLPQPVQVSYRIQELAIDAHVEDQAARVQMTQTFINTSSYPMEVQFVFPLPPDSAVDRLTFLVDGQEVPGKLLPADEARRIYEQYVRRLRDPALLEWLGQGMFRTSVFPVPPGGKRQVILRYQQLLRRQDRLVHLHIPLATARYTSKPLEKLSVNISLACTSKLKNLYSPNHAVTIRRADAQHAHVTYQATDVVPTTDFQLYFDMDAGPLSASLVSYRPNDSEDGYFALLAAPDLGTSEAMIARKTVVLVVDRSGSMNGKKIEQAKEALRFIVNNLSQNDLFNIVVYDSEVELFRPELQRYNEESRSAALAFVDSIYAGGSTNIDSALTTAFNMLRHASGPQYVLFLTDGLPTVGERNELRIAANARQNNQSRARLLAFGVGYDVNSRLLDRLTRENNGLSVYVRPDEDLEQAISLFYNRIRAPVLTNVVIDIHIEPNGYTGGQPVNRVYPRHVSDLFAGEQLVLVGRYRYAGQGKVTIRGQLGSMEKSFEFPVNFVSKSTDHRYNFVEKLWAVRRIGEIIDELDLHGKNDELIRELVELSTKHGILTPYTAFLAEEEGRRQLARNQALSDRASSIADQLRVTEGSLAFEQRLAKQAYMRASDLSGPAAGGFGGFGGSTGSFPGVPSAALPAHPGNTSPAASQLGLRQVGNFALYKQGDIWVASNARDVDPLRDERAIQKIARFSPEYFQLLERTSPEENQLLAAQVPGEKLLVRLQGTVYMIE